MLDRITRNELESVDEEIRDVIEVINRAPYARTIASCAGYGIAGESRNRHRRDETEKAYLAVDYDTTDPKWETMHLGLCEIARFVRAVDPNRAVYQFGYPDLKQTRSQWQKVRELLRGVVNS